MLSDKANFNLRKQMAVKAVIGVDCAHEKLDTSMILQTRLALSVYMPCRVRDLESVPDMLQQQSVKQVSEL